jgi:hypothetical protein
MPKPSEEPDPLPLPEWPSSEEPDRPIDAPPPAPPQAGAGEWHRFSVQGDGVLQPNQPDVASFGGQDDREVMRNILRRLDEVVDILRQMT